MDKYYVLQDKREQDGWYFGKYGYCLGMKPGTLHTGDYTIEGHEDAICVERKATTAEIAINLGKKKDAFHAEMQRMKDFEFSFMICEFSMSDVLKFPKDSGLPPDRQEETRITGKYMLRSLLEIQLWYDTKILFCDSKYNGFLVCSSLFKRFYELMNNVQ